VTVVTALTLLTTGCGGEEEAGARPGEGTTLRIAVNPWTGSAVNANVAKVILERELGYTVELVEIDEYAQFPELARGDLDAALEVWPSGHAEDYLRYIEGRRGGPLRDGGVVDGGKLGVAGNIGWWVPTYLLEERPELATWEGIKGNEDVFRTAESGDKGQFLAGDPTFVSYDREIIENLGLDLEVVSSGSEEALVSALDAAYQQREPLLLYFYTPHWAHRKYDLTEVELPAFDDACAESAREKQGEGYDCDYADDTGIYKAFWINLEEKAPDAFRFLSNFNYANEDQEQIATLVDSEGLDVAEAAAQWVSENEDVWRAWLG
jgi:glycine betaine/proline transport system substrate-binding protein